MLLLLIVRKALGIKPSPAPPTHWDGTLPWTASPGSKQVSPTTCPFCSPFSDMLLLHRSEEQSEMPVANDMLEQRQLLRHVICFGWLR